MEKVLMFIMVVCLVFQFYDVLLFVEGNNICFVIYLVIFILYKFMYLIICLEFDFWVGIYIDSFLNFFINC